MKRGLLFIFGILFFTSLISCVNAGVYLSQPELIYNKGDFMSLNITIDPVQDGPLKLKIVCGSNSKEIFSGPAIDNINIPLNTQWIGDLSGECYVEADYGTEVKKTQTFQISKKLNVLLNIDSFFPKPGEEITISGKVKRMNGENSDGEVEINAPFLVTVQTQTNEANTTNSNESSVSTVSGGLFYGKVSNGDFSVSLNVPEKAAAGDYKIIVKAYEKDKEEKTNEGQAIASVKIAQILTSIDIALSNQNFNPGDTLALKPSLMDQSGNPITDDVSIVIVSDDGTRVFEKIIKSSESTEYKIPTDSLSGYYLLKVSSGVMNISKNFFINEKAIASFELRNDTLVITNIGNIRYKKDVQVELNGKPFVKSVNLGLGESKEFKLTGTNGAYDIKVSDGESEFKQGGVMLTGNAIAVKDTGAGGVIARALYTPVLWIFIIIILVVVALIFYRNVIKKRSVAYPNESKTLKLDNVMKIEKKPESSPVSEIKKMILPKRAMIPTHGEQGLVTTGQRNRAGILCIKLKNKITKLGKDQLDKMMQNVFSRKGVVYEQGDCIFIILSPLVTRTFNNEVEAARLGEKLVSDLKEYNNKFNEKIEFGIGINSGDIINEIKDGKLKFSAIGNTILLAKKLAEASKEQVLLTKEAYEKGISEIKAEKIKVRDMEAYEVRKVVDHEKSKKFIEDFLKREAKDKKLGNKHMNNYNLGSPVNNNINNNTARENKSDDFKLETYK